MSNYSSLFRVLSPSRVQTKFEEKSLPARYTDIMIFCLVQGDAIKNSFPIDTRNYATFGHLRTAIKDAKQNAFVGIDADRLTLWRVDIIQTKENQEVIVKEHKGVELHSFESVGSYFQETPTSTNIRIIVEPPPPATTGKRKAEDSDKDQNSKRVKLADPKIISTAHRIMEDIMKLDENETIYSDPKNFLSLPYPYLGEKLPIDRFDIDHDGSFIFMGRTKFEQVLEDINKLRPRSYMKLFIYGTVGYGKSHILTAIACFLFRTRRRVVFLPDCRQLAVDPVEYIKLALFLTYENDDVKISEINACEDFCQIIKFCKSLEEKLYFIVDQMNALDEGDNTGISLEKKRQIRENLDKMVDNHFYIMSSSANNKTMLHLMAKQTGELKIKLFGGFDEGEMKEWWNKHNSDLPAMDEQQIRQIEDISGKIPLFLKFLLESDHKNFKDAWEYLDQQLTSKIKEPMMNFSDIISSSNRWELHVKLMKSFLTNKDPTDGYGHNDYDHRFFYVDNGKCYYVCGLARDCMANYLYGKDRMEIFIDINWIKSFKNNPSVKGFIIEKACIASICKNGIMANSIRFKVDSHQFFSGVEDINFSLSEGACTFYLPHKWNQKSIDGLLALYKTELKSNIPKDVVIIFIWITCKNGADEEVEMKIKKLRNRDVEINPDYISVVTGFANVNKDIDRYLSQV
ncbi:unnamed protein product [Rhizophagus irregularis]|uniref:Crinkler effector protein N-terminal domain-containing protein n=1 Tax=Rhizophagus irregularis TaxID=588596 RepID=A0A916EA13_9GLOM|nr:unnamed protein product [Rhizophagus irregularis]